MIGRMRVSPLVLVAALAIGSQAGAWGWHHKEADEFDEAEVLVEINATDGDAGFQGKIDGDAWKKVRLFGPWWRTLFSVALKGSAREQGFTEFVWESAEPEFSEVGLDEFLDRFPEGDYVFEARTIENGRLRSVAELTHELPAGPVITSPEEGEGVPSGVDLLIEWDAVTTTFAVDDPLGENTPPLDSAIVRYIVVAEFEDEDEDVFEVLEMEIQVPEDDMSGSYSATIPGDFLRFADSEGYKIEVGAVEESGNRTFSEIEICTDEECPEDDDEE